MTADLERRLRGRLAEPLPGGAGQLLLAPRPRRGWRPDRVPDDARLGAGLLLLYRYDDLVRLVLTLRAGELPLHAGQVSLPGGAVEPGESPEQTALREAGEEIGVDPRAVRVVGRLSPLHIPVSRFALYPVVGLTDTRPELRPKAGEVARILEVGLDELQDPATLGLEKRHRDGVDYEVPYFNLHGERVWGATAMILSEFLCLLDYRPDPWGQT